VIAIDSKSNSYAFLCYRMGRSSVQVAIVYHPSYDAMVNGIAETYQTKRAVLPGSRTAATVQKSNLNAPTIFVFIKPIYVTELMIVAMGQMKIQQYVVSTLLS